MGITAWCPAAGQDGSPLYAALEAWPGGRTAVMRLTAQRGGWAARVDVTGEAPQLAVLHDQAAAEAWCARTAEAALRRLGPVLAREWNRIREDWRADVAGPVQLRLTATQVAGAWTGIVERAGSREAVRQPGWSAPELAMDWCERTAAVYLRDAS